MAESIAISLWWFLKKQGKNPGVLEICIALSGWKEYWRTLSWGLRRKSPKPGECGEDMSKLQSQDYVCVLSCI